jgi:hypothetical protein
VRRDRSNESLEDLTGHPYFPRKISSEIRNSTHSVKVEYVIVKDNEYTMLLVNQLRVTLRNWVLLICLKNMIGKALPFAT